LKLAVARAEKFGWHQLGLLWQSPCITYQGKDVACTLVYLEEAGLLWIHVIQRNVSDIGLLINKHGVSLTECAAADVLTTDSHVEPYAARITQFLFIQSSPRKA